MGTARRTDKMKRTQVCLPQEEFTAVQRIAEKRKVSMSQVVRSALRRELDAEASTEERMLSIIGLGEGSDPEGSEKHDAIIYG